MEDSLLEDQARELVRLAARLIRYTQAETERTPGELRDLLRAHGLAPRHLHAMIPLALHGPMTVNELAGRLALAPASVSQLVGELGAASLVTRAVDAKDRRKARISLVPSIQAKIATFAEARIRPFRAALARMVPTDREAFLQDWHTLVASVEDERTSLPT
jgi:DNA-binding MarR family transcriptional regulator